MLVYLLLLGQLPAHAQLIGSTSKRADQIEDKKVEKKSWFQRGPSNLQNRTFPIQDWDKHYSSLGSRRAPVAVNQEMSKKQFRTSVIEREVFNAELSQWNQRLADLHKKAGLDLDNEAKIAANRQLYYMMLQDARSYQELGAELSLRDLNRFQFRSNRSDGPIPTTRVGEK